MTASKTAPKRAKKPTAAEKLAALEAKNAELEAAVANSAQGSTTPPAKPQNMVNTVTFEGRLGDNPETTQVPAREGMALKCTFRVCSTRVYNDTQTGQPVSVETWMPVVTWRKQAENCARNLIKGQTVIVEGRIESRSYVDSNLQATAERPNANRRIAVELVADRVNFRNKPFGFWPENGGPGTNGDAPSA